MIDEIESKNEEEYVFTDWDNEPTVSDLEQLITDADDDQALHLADVTRWMDNMTMTGSASVKKIKGRSSVAPKLIRKQAEWRYSSLSEPFLSTPDLFNVNPVTSGDRNRAKQNQLVLNNQFNTKINKLHFIDSYIREGVDVGTVIVKTGWETEYAEIEVDEPVFTYLPVHGDQKLFQRYQSIAQIKQTKPDSYADFATPELDKAMEIFLQTGQVMVVRQTGTEKVMKTVETLNQPTVDIPSSENIIIDPSCEGNTDKASFWGERFKASLADLKNDPKYHNLSAINKDAASPISDPDYVENSDITSFTFKDDIRKQFVVRTYWGTWDINNDGKVKQIVASWVGKVMIRLEINPFPDNKPPFVKVVYMPVRRSVFGEPDAELLEDNQRIIGAVTRGMIDIMGKSANGQKGVKKGLLDTTNQRKFKNGDDYEFNSNEDPRQAIHSHVYPEIPQSAYNMLNLQNMDAESLSGVKAFSSGITGASLGNSVSNGRSALDAASKRELGILRRFAAGIIEIGKKFISMNAEFLSEEETIRITNEKFIQVRRDDLAGNFDLRLSISTAEEDNSKAEQLAFMLQTTGPNMDPELSKMILSDIANLRKMPDLAKKIEEYQPQQSEEEKIKIQLELELLQKQVIKEEALAMKHAAEAEAAGHRGAKDFTQAQLNQAKTGTEAAKAKDISSDADLKDLEYLEQESGVHQERTLQQINTKAKNEAGIKLLEKGQQNDTRNYAVSPT